MVWAPSRADWMIAFLGTLLAGGVIVPLDNGSKEDFIERIAQTTEATYIITTGKQYATLKKVSLPLLDLDNLPQGTLDAGVLPEVTGDDLAELVFTSGTTGQPKGVILTHWNITSDAQAALKVVQITEEDRTLSILPLSHMFEMTIEIAEFHGGASILYARSLNPETLLRLLGTQSVTCMVLVPQALQLFMNGLNIYPEDIENMLLTNPAIKDAAVIGLMEKGEGPTVHAILLMEDPEQQAKTAIAQTNKQLVPHQQICGFTIWPEKDFPRTHTLKVKRPEVLKQLHSIRNQVKA